MRTPGTTGDGPAPSGPAAPGGTKARIQQTALDLFVQQGYEKTSLREISDGLGITKAALYYHFTSKQELLQSITQPLLDGLEEILAALGGTRDLLTAFVGLMERHQRVFEIFVADHAALVAAELAERSGALRQALIGRLSGPGASFADHVRAAAALGAVTQGFVLARNLEPETALVGLAGPGGQLDGDELAELLVGAALRVLEHPDA
jgi:AcrR family transcriptional regulator